MNDFTTEQENKKPATAKAVALIFGTALIIISATTSAAFFSTYAAGLFNFVTPELSPLLSAIVGVVVFEGASITWAWLRANDADTKNQLSTASIGAWASMAGGLIVTACYFALNTSLLFERLDAQALTVISLSSGVLIILGVALNFALAHIYRVNSATNQEAENSAELRAMSADARHTVRQETTQARLAQTIDIIRQQIPAQSRAQGEHDAAEMLARMFAQALTESEAQLRETDDPEDEPARPFQNGRR